MTRDLVIASLELQQWTSIDPETVRCSEVPTTATLYYTLPNYSNWVYGSPLSDCLHWLPGGSFLASEWQAIPTMSWC
jgi:hypothetical protein